MVGVSVYFLASYLLIIAILALLWWRLGPLKKPWTWRLRYLTVFLLALPWLPYVVVDAQTALYGPGMLPALRKTLKETFAEDTILSYKVLWVQPGCAQVYVIQPCGTGGSGHRVGLALWMTRDAHGWRYTSDESPGAVWSDCGNADGNTFPPYLDGF